MKYFKVFFSPSGDIVVVRAKNKTEAKILAVAYRITSGDPSTKVYDMKELTVINGGK